MRAMLIKPKHEKASSPILISIVSNRFSMSHPTAPSHAPQPPSASFRKGKRRAYIHTLRGKLIIGLIPGLVALLILLGVSLKATDILVAANRHLGDVGRELAITRGLQLTLEQIFLLLHPHDNIPLQPDAELYAHFLQDARVMEEQLRQAQAMYGEDPERRAFNETMANWEAVVSLATKLLEPQASDLADRDSKRIQDDLQKEMMAMKISLQSLNDAVMGEMEKSMTEGQRAHDQASLVIIVSTIIALLSGVVFMFWFAGYLTTPLATLANSARRLGQGDLEVRIDIQRQDEIGDLAHEFNLMATQLQKRTDELEAVSAERTAYAQQLQQVLRRNVHIQEVERKRIANDIHDGVSQWLMGAMFEVQAARVRLSDANADVVAHLEEAQHVLKEVKEEMRRVIYDLHPPLLESHGLVTALRSLAQDQQARFHFPIHFEVTGEPYRLALDQELALYRIAQEALANVHKHADATQALLRLHFTPVQVTLSVQDDGVGFDITSEIWTHKKHLGLISMRERAIAVGADFAIHAQIGQGAIVRVSVPVSTHPWTVKFE